MKETINVAVLVSGGGTNLQAIIDRVYDRTLSNVELVGVIASRDNAFALKRARKAGIPTWVAPTQEEVMDKLERCRAELIVMAGYMQILSPEIVKKYEGRIINIHPALIPKYCGKGFYGMNVHRAVIQAGETESGATLHYVDEGIDTGEIIMQETVPVFTNDTPEELALRVLDVEHRILVEGLKVVANKLCM